MSLWSKYKCYQKTNEIKKAIIPTPPSTPPSERAASFVSASKASTAAFSFGAEKSGAVASALEFQRTDETNVGEVVSQRESDSVSSLHFIFSLN